MIKLSKWLLIMITPVLLFFGDDALGMEKGHSLISKIRTIQRYHEEVFERLPVIANWLSSFEKCRLLREHHELCIDWGSDAEKAISVVLASESDMIEALDDVVEHFNTFPHGRPHSQLTEVEKQIFDMMAFAEAHKNTSRFFLKIFDSHKNKLDELRKKAKEVKTDTKKLRRFFILYRDLMIFLYKGLKVCSKLKHYITNSSETLENEFHPENMANEMLRGNTEMERVIVLLNRIFKTPCPSCQADLIWGIDYAAKINHSQVRTYLSDLKRLTGYEWSLPSINALESIKFRVIKSHLRKWGNGFFICLPGVKEGGNPLLEFDPVTMEGSVYRSFGTSAIIPVRISGDAKKME